MRVNEANGQSRCNLAFAPLPVGIIIPNLCCFIFTSSVKNISVAKIVTNFVRFARSLLVWLHADIIGDASGPSQLRRWHRRKVQDEFPLKSRIHQYGDLLGDSLVIRWGFSSDMRSLVLATLASWLVGGNAFFFGNVFPKTKPSYKYKPSYRPGSSIFRYLLTASSFECEQLSTSGLHCQ